MWKMFPSLLFNHIIVAGAVASLLFVDIMVMEVLLCAL
jgi:hypothetical protein